MSWITEKWKYLAIPFAVYIVLVGVVALALFVSGKLSLFWLGNALLYLGLGIAILGFFFANFQRTSVDIHVRHQGSTEHRRERAKADVSDFNVGLTLIFLGVMLFVTGWLVVDLASCGKLICG